MNQRLLREIGLFGLVVYGVGDILGAGIYTLIGAAAGIAGDGLWVAFLLSASIALLTGLSYAELATMFPKAGAEYHFVRHGFNSSRVGFIAGWAIIAGSVTAVATVALGFAGYLEEMTGIPRLLGAFVLIGALSAVNFVGIRHSTQVNVVLTLVEVGGLLLVVALGLTAGIDALTPRIPGEPSGIVSAAALLFFSYLGFEHIANVAEESRNPEQTVPIALVGAIAISSALYTAVSLSALALATPGDLAESSAPLSLVAARVLGASGASLLSVIALLATTNTALLLLVATSRLVFGMAREGVLPLALTDINPSTHTPGSAVVLLMLLSWAFLPFGTVRVVGSLSSFSALFAFTLVNAALIGLRYSRPQAERPFRSPVNVGRFPVLALLGALTAAGAALLLEPAAILTGVAILAAGLIASFVLPVRPLS